MRDIRPVFAVALLVLVTGCGGSNPHARLNTMTDFVDPGYGAAVALCDALEGRAIARAETRDEAETQIEELRADCDLVFAGFEDARAAQLAARAVADAVEDGRADVSDLLRSLDEARAVYEAAAATVAAFRRKWSTP